MKIARGLPLLVLASCATTSEMQSEVRSGTQCFGDPAASFVGRSYSDSLGNEVRTATGARLLRIVRPGDMVTMDYRTDRLTVTLDDQGRISRATCG